MDVYDVKPLRVLLSTKFFIFHAAAEFILQWMRAPVEEHAKRQPRALSLWQKTPRRIGWP
jgi:hypothetical protein